MRKEKATLRTKFCAFGADIPSSIFRDKNRLVYVDSSKILTQLLRLLPLVQQTTRTEKANLAFGADIPPKQHPRLELNKMQFTS